MQTQPVENIDAVLGRFQAWAGSRNAVEVKPGIRELSYEEALQSSRYRWKAAGKTSAKKKPEPTPGALPGVVRAVAPVAASDPERELRKTAQANNRNPKQRAAGKARDEVHAAKANRGLKMARVAPVAKAASAAKKETKPAFRDVLAETVRPEVILSAAQPMELARQVAISIRLAPAERALIKTRAAEAGVTASAYIRQCALEVEQLRTQVQRTLAALERKGSAAVPASVASEGSGPGFFARMVRRFFSRSEPALALRA